MALPAIGPRGRPGAAGSVVLLLVLIVLVVSTERAPDGRGWHDRLADTEVVSTDASRPARHASALAIVAPLGIVAAGWWLHAPEGVSSNFGSFPEAERISCAVTHDGWLYPHYERTVTLRPGAEPFTGRFGPHDVTLAFIDDTDAGTIQRGLRIEVATRSLGSTTGRSTGTDHRTVHATIVPTSGN